jgi:hypothetical protein
MPQDICPESLPEGGQPERSANSGTACPACLGRGRKFTTLRRMAAAAGGSSETELLKRTQSDYLTCACSGQAPGSMSGQAGD